MPSAARLAACFAIGAVAGTLLDGLHLLGDVLSYEHEAFGEWAWFVPLEFGLAGVAAGVAIPVLERAVGPQVPPYFDTVGRVRGGGALYRSVWRYGLVRRRWGAVWLLAGLTLLVVIRLWLWPVPGDWAYAAIAAVVGPAAEVAISATGAFDYANPDFAGIPMWLPALWANGGLLIRRLLGPVVLIGGKKTRRSPVWWS